MSNTALAGAAGDREKPQGDRPGDSPAAVVQASELPGALASLVLGVTGKCRLWNRERVEVARELCAHFRDGLEAGAAPHALAESFGDPRRAARLITKARKRLRPWWWHATRAALRATGTLVLLLAMTYGVLAARFFLASPRMTRDFIAELNAPIRATATGDRAWPLYLQAKIEFGTTPDFMNDGGPDPLRPGDANWDRWAQWLGEHDRALRTLRTAAAKPTIGNLYRPTMDPDLERALVITNPRYAPPPGEDREIQNPLVIGLLLPHLGEMRQDARRLRADAAIAAGTGDRARFIADVGALLGMGEQALKDHFAISEQVGIAIGEVAVALVLDHATDPGLLTDEDLRDLAHRVGSFGGTPLLLDLSLETLAFDDILQRFFTDDGHGDGRFVGGPALTHVMDDFGVARPRAFVLVRAFQPVQSALLPSRAQLKQKVDRVAAAAAVDNALPPWRHDERTADIANADLMESGIFAVVPFLKSLYNTDAGGVYSTMFAARDAFRTRRDAAATVLALESWRRAHGAWPRSLEELTPGYLPAVPLDPFDGKPLRYLPPKSDGERPTVYSVGVDALDEGGKLATTESGRHGVSNLHWQAKFRGKSGVTADERTHLDDARADWVLWPVPEPLQAAPGK
jgi:hypothetical protein